jgi:hypothetical protein
VAQPDKPGKIVMELTLEGIGKKVGAQSWLYDMSLAPKHDAVTVLSRLRERGTNLGIGLRANNRGDLQAYALAKRMNTGFAGGYLIQEKFVTHFARNDKQKALLPDRLHFGEA